MKSRLILRVVALAVIAAVAWRYYPRPDPRTASGPPLVDVTVPQLDAAAQAGEAAFNENCADCHGANAAGQQGVAPPLVHIIYEPNHHGDQSFYRRETGRSRPPLAFR
ncbi:MAG: c-type cytochrome [Rhizobiaceae bacterium]